VQMAVLASLCRPFQVSGPFAAPAANAVIAEELHISVQTVKSHLRSLFQVFGLQDLPQNQKRARLAETAVRHGLVTVGGGA
jgi:DNA-binding NarL/FixJ family response regulator